MFAAFFEENILIILLMNLLSTLLFQKVFNDNIMLQNYHCDIVKYV